MAKNLIDELEQTEAQLERQVSDGTHSYEANKRALVELRSKTSGETSRVQELESQLSVVNDKLQQEVQAHEESRHAAVRSQGLVSRLRDQMKAISQAAAAGLQFSAPPPTSPQAPSGALLHLSVSLRLPCSI